MGYSRSLGQDDFSEFDNDEHNPRDSIDGSQINNPDDDSQNQPEKFVDTIVGKTQKVVDADRLDNAGFEYDDIAVLDLQMDQ